MKTIIGICLLQTLVISVLVVKVISMESALRNLKTRAPAIRDHVAPNRSTRLQPAKSTPISPDDLRRAIRAELADWANQYTARAASETRTVQPTEALSEAIVQDFNDQMISLMHDDVFSETDLQAMETIIVKHPPEHRRQLMATLMISMNQYNVRVQW